MEIMSGEKRLKIDVIAEQLKGNAWVRRILTTRAKRTPPKLSLNLHRISPP
jgi:hypothetical protein